MQRYFLETPQQDGDQVTLPATVQHHWVVVLRAQVGDVAEFVDQTAHLFHGELLRVTNDGHAEVRLTAVVTPTVELPAHVIIACGLPKQEKAEWIAQKATEMGVQQVIFYGADWSIAKWHSQKVAKKVARLTKVANGAAEQSHRLVRPTVTYVPNLAAVLATPNDLTLMAYEESAKRGEHSALTANLQRVVAGQTVLAIFGPEGGISPAEVTQAQTAHAILVGLGPRILRTETAPLYFLAAASTIWELQSPQRG
ncbi:RsmE family RNA methyltransferase [Levilactobacillus suantsaii]|uniref:Ribosomal RNA small subunit methyltransferase E n=1 Tax=Levilactobacillus suantsaii TaxID=2292255 RepID=A0A4Q0VM19_9LACO|nr:RsmE family RNA methyltransferase [Levilactobacillus suantsaii]QMU07554.1 16S rRNA (uracil(1498)-N(3))-methyltransferase [Levilactobacillus suantsaii]RXI79621.1 16S rRNA (uracil(1498)-N(3))-methyltransferase [Levilactobacillus suantsaii]